MCCIYKKKESAQHNTTQHAHTEHTHPNLIYMHVSLLSSVLLSCVFSSPLSPPVWYNNNDTLQHCYPLSLYTRVITQHHATHDTNEDCLFYSVAAIPMCKIYMYIPMMITLVVM